MIGTEPTLGLGPANQATLYVILSPVGAYFGSEIKPVTLKCEGELISVPTPPLGLASQMLNQLQDIYYGRYKHTWAVDIQENTSQDLALVQQEEKCVSIL